MTEIKFVLDPSNPPKKGSRKFWCVRFRNECGDRKSVNFNTEKKALKFLESLSEDSYDIKTEFWYSNNII